MCRNMTEGNRKQRGKRTLLIEPPASQTNHPAVNEVGEEDKFDEMRYISRQGDELVTSGPVVHQPSPMRSDTSETFAPQLYHHHHHHHHLSSHRQKKNHHPDYYHELNEGNRVMMPSSDQEKNKASLGQRRRRKSELSSFLMILFGSVLLLLTTVRLCSSVRVDPTVGPSPLKSTPDDNLLATRQSDKTEEADRLSTTANKTGKVSLSLKEAPHSTTVTDTAAPDEESASDDDERDIEFGTGSVEGDDRSNKTRLAKLLVDTLNSGADMLISRHRESTDDESETHTTSDVKEDSRSDKEVDPPEERVQTISPLNSTALDAEALRYALEAYSRWRSTTDDITELFSRKMLPVIMEHSYDIDSVTMTNLLQIWNGIRTLQPWALKLLDASAKLAPGILVGTQSDFGDFDECLNIRVDDPSGLASQSDLPVEYDEKTGMKTTTVVGRYCLADVEFPKPPRARLAHQRRGELHPDYAPIELRRPLLNFNETIFKDTIFVETASFFHMLYVDPIRTGFCLTNKIDPDTFERVFNKLVEDFRVSIHFRGRCVTKYDRYNWTTYQIISSYVLIVACSLVIISTILDLLHTKLNKLPCPQSWNPIRMRLKAAAFRYRPMFTSFSIIRNTKRLFKPHQASSGNRQQVLRSSNDNNILSLNLTGHGKQVNLNLAQAISGPVTTATTSSIADSSVESSPSIERRASSTDGSAMNLILGESTCSNKLYAIHRSSYSSDSIQKSASSSDWGLNLLSLHGIRVITMTWMIVNHTYMFGGFFVLWAHRRLIDIAEWPKSMSFQLVLNGWLTVETYFFLSALIIVLNVMPLMRRRKFGYFYYILHRLLRLMPAYIGLVCMNFLWPLISSGPVWLVKGKSFIQTPCENNLWTNFLFINNWIWPEKQCMVHTWFLSADFQLYLLAPIIVYLLHRRPALGHSLNLIVAITASVLSGFVIYANQLLPTTLINKLEFDSIKQQLSYSYFATYQHMGPYCLGILTGYMLHKRPKMRLPKHLSWILWLLLPPLSFTTLLLTYLWNGAYDDPDLINPSPLVSAFYVAIHRTIWTSLVAWIVFACTTGRARLLSNFLSHAIFVPLSRLSFSIYLVHLPVIMFRAFNLRHTVEWTDINILWEACGNFIVSIILGYFLNIAFESPIINLEHIVFGRASELGAKSSLAGGGDGVSEDEEQRQALSSVRNSIDEKLSSHSLSQTDSGGKGSEASQTCDFSDELGSNGTVSSNEQQSSPERDRKSGITSKNNSKLGDGTNQINGIIAQQNNIDRHSQWENQNNKPVLIKRRSLTPNESSVERIFGQTNPESSTTSGSVVTDARSRLNALPRADLLERRRYRLSLSERPSFNGTGGGGIPGDDDIYNISGEYRHYAPGMSYQQWRMNNTSKPLQYATLARTSRLDQNPLDLNCPPYNQRAGPYLNPLRDFPNDSLSYNNGTVPHMESRQRGLGPMIQRRQGRYNTLTGTGTRDWRLRHARKADDSERWPAPQKQHFTVESMSSSDWLQPGATLFLPRIDSSTLRRQMQRVEAVERSIVEDPAEENSAL